MSDIGKHRQEYLKWLRADRAKRLAQNAELYAAIPANIRAAIAKVAGVDNKRLDELDAAQRRKMNIETRKLIATLIKAHVIIAATDTTRGE
jgi:hypothetical protein